MERRDSARLDTELRVGCRIPASPAQGTILNLSRTGCRMEFAHGMVPSGSTIHVEMGSGPPVVGQVVWTVGREAGIRFNSALSGNAAVRLGLEKPAPEAPPVERPAEQEPPVAGLLRHWIRRLTGAFAG